jgi:O-methyltransferase
MIKTWLDNVGERALSTRNTLYATYDIARTVLRNGTPGDFVECGVFTGSNAAAMARAIMDAEWIPGTDGKMHPHRSNRRLHLFDSFYGIPQAGPEDREFLEAGHQAGLSACPLVAVQAHMREWGIPNEVLVWHPGWFVETMAPFKEGISLLRLDGDLYESTRLCMQHLYPLVSPGGWVICDDFHLSGARKAVEEVVMPSPCYWIKE